MPTFIFFRNKTKVDSQRGADPVALEEKIKKWYSGDDSAGDLGVKGHVSCLKQRFFFFWQKASLLKSESQFIEEKIECCMQPGKIGATRVFGKVLGRKVTASPNASPNLPVVPSLLFVWCLGYLCKWKANRLPNVPPPPETSSWCLFYPTFKYSREMGQDVHQCIAFFPQMDLSSMISKSGCECLNEADDHPLEHALTSKGGYLESDCDEQVQILNQKHDKS